MNNWDCFWSIYNLKDFGNRYHHYIVFNVFEKFLKHTKIKNPQIIELGCGSGELTARILKKFGGAAFLVDNSKKAIETAKNNFKEHKLKAIFLQKNIFKLNLKRKFDIVHSEGLIEHFTEDQQKRIIEVHKRLVKRNGFILICVPRPSLFYKLWKFYLEKRKKWPFGYEKAMNKCELKKILENCGLKVIKLIEKGRYSFALAKI